MPIIYHGSRFNEVPMSKFDFSNAMFLNNGQLDLDATVEAFTNALTTWYDSEREVLGKVRAACLSAFEAYPNGTRLPKPLVVQVAMMRLGATPETWRSYEEKISIVLGDRSTFDVARGRAGGVSLV